MPWIVDPPGSHSNTNPTHPRREFAFEFEATAYAEQCPAHTRVYYAAEKKDVGCVAEKNEEESARTAPALRTATQVAAYLGDGVYSRFDGYQIWIWTSNGIESSQPTALEPTTFNQLLSFAAKHWNMNRNGKIES